MRKIFIGAFSLLCLNGCNMLDDYMLGKDNTATPAQLKNISSKVVLTKRWHENTSLKNEAASNFYKLVPTIKNGVIYSASASGLVQARAKLTGKLIWSKKVSSGVTSGPEVNSSIIVVGDVDASVIALSIKDGATLWQSNVSNQLLAQPIISKNRVYAKTIDGKLYSFNALTGKRLWRYEHGARNLILRASSAPVVVGHLVLAGFADGKLDAINLATGRLEWQRNITFSKGSSEVERMVDIDATPIVKNDIVYIASYQGDVSALSLRNGNALWSHKISAFRDFAVDQKALYLVDINSHIWALNRYNGTVLWHQKNLHDRGLNAPALSSAGLVLTDNYGFMHVLSTTTGEEIGRTQLTSKQIDSAPLIDDTDVYVLFENGLLTNYKMVS